MKIKYFQDTDTLYIEFRSVDVAETKDLDENTLLDNVSASWEEAKERIRSRLWLSNSAFCQKQSRGVINNNHCLCRS